jgi:hypothetical protein
MHAQRPPSEDVSSEHLIRPSPPDHEVHFSVRTLLAAVTLLCVGAGLVRAAPWIFRQAAHVVQQWDDDQQVDVKPIAPRTPPFQD